MKYNRILLKLSGEALMGNQKYGIDSDVLSSYAKDVKSIVDQECQIAIVIGGGNIYRGIQSEKSGFDRVQGDHMGMLATIINGMALQSALESLNIETRLQTAIRMEQIAEPYIRRRAIRHLEKNRVVIFGGGTGNPYFTTDTAAALRAVEIEADTILKGTRVDGVYSADPEKDKNATKFETITFDEAYNLDLKIMDLTAFTLCKENKLPINVFNMNTKGNLLKVCEGKKVGTLINL
ncbi:MAG: UMP kinase [Flavobacteriales bacterium]